MPVAIAKKICSLNPKDLLARVQNSANNWYLNKVLNSKDGEQNDTDPVDSVNSEHRDLDQNLFDIPDPSDDFLADVTREEVWGNYESNAEKSDEK